MDKTIVGTVLALVLLVHSGNAQTGKEHMPEGTIPERSWWNLLHYSIDITPDYDTKTIRGSNTISFIALKPGTDIRIDLMHSMKLTAVEWQGRKLKADSIHDAWLVHFPRTIAAGEKVDLTVWYGGHPTEAVKPPWGQSGWIWAVDKLGRPWYSLACEGTGALVWMPCKNTLYDEPDNGVDFSITVPDTLVAVGNGRLMDTTKNRDHSATYHWKVTSTINGYDICPYVGKYLTWHHDYKGTGGKLDCDYWVLDYNRPKAERHFAAVDSLLRCFEKWLGPYPFYEDSYKVVESPMSGMEHQSAIAYGNGFADGYGGKSLSGTPWGERWDFVLVHESGHEWFGNSVTACGDGDSWIHEGFTKYLEVIYTSEWFGTAAGDEYALGISKRIKNDAPVIGGGTSDQYYKGAAMLHIIRKVVGDATFRKMLHALQRDFYHSTITTAQVLASMRKTSGMDLSHIFQQYLYTIQVPVFEYRFEGRHLSYRWADCVPGFDMPFEVTVGDRGISLNPSTTWQTLRLEPGVNGLLADPAFYVRLKRL